MFKTLSQRILVSLTLLLGAMSAASAANRFYADATAVEPGETATIELKLDNEQTLYGFQADVVLPAGLSITNLALSPRAGAGYTLVSNTLADGTVRIGAFSLSHSAIAGNAGALVYAAVAADSGFNGGILALRNVIFIGEGDRDVEFPDCDVTIAAVPVNTFTIADFEMTAGETETVAIALGNETPFTAFQTDLYLPEGITADETSFRLTSRGADDHVISVRNFAGGRTRITCFSLSGAVFAGNSGDLLLFDVTAAYDADEACVARLDNQLFSRADAKEYRLPASVANVTVHPAPEAEIVGLSYDEPAYQRNAVSGTDVSFAYILHVNNHNEARGDSYQVVITLYNRATGSIVASATFTDHTLRSNAAAVRGIVDSNHRGIQATHRLDGRADFYGIEDNIDIVAMAQYAVNDYPLSDQEEIPFISPITTAISEVETSQSAATEVYDLLGRKIHSPACGINIIGGKKILTK